MMKKLMIGAGLAALIGGSALALQPDGGRRGGHGMPEGPMTRAQVQAKVQERFTAMDGNKDGAVTQAEFDAHKAARMAERKAKRAERHAERFTAMDGNKDGQVSRGEYDAAAQQREQRWAERGKDGGRGDHRGWRGHRGGGWMGGRGGDWFARLDANKDGRVTLAEASAKPLEMFDRADANKDGTVTPEERKAAREQMRAEWKAKRG